VLNERCEYAAETIVFSREAYKAQVRCGLTAFGTLLDALQKAGVYDQTAIALLADHGTTGIISPRAAPTTIAAANLVSIANPTFAFKPLGAGGAMKRVDQPISLADMTSIICADVGDCPTPRKVPDTHRNFNFYRWSQAFWTSEAPPVITAYKITGQPMWDGALWQREMSPVALGEKIDFTSTGDTARYRGTGWANPESWGIWTVGNTAELSFGLSAAPQDLLLDLDTQGFPTADGVQAATVLANDMKVGTLSYDTKTLFQQSTFKIPAEIVRNGGGVLRVTLAVEKPTSPKSLGQSVDTRELGIGLHWMKLRGANDGS
jgi:hypothetical protein